jgi:hypothetical protein
MLSPRTMSMKASSSRANSTSDDPRPAYERAVSIYNALHGFKAGYFVTGETYIVLCVSTQGSPAPLGRDENGRFEFSLNFEVTVKNENRRA